MKFGKLIEQKILYQMSPSLSQSNMAFKFKPKVKLTLINDIEFDLESNVGLE